jgi:WD40 repeat protein
MARLEFSLDGSLLMSASGRGSVSLWEVTGTDLRPYLGWRRGRATSMRNRRQGRDQAMRANADPTPRHVEHVQCAAFAPDGRALAVGGYYTRIIEGGDYPYWVASLLDAATGAPLGDPLADDVYLPDYAGHTADLTCLAFHPDGRVLVTASKDGTLRVWDVGTRQPRAFIGVDGPEALACAFSPDGHLLATAADAYREGFGAVELWDTATWDRIGDPIIGHIGAATCVTFSPDSKSLATAGSDGPIWLWNTRSRAQDSEPLLGHTGPVTSVTFSPDGALLATAGNDGTARLWDATRRTQLGDPIRSPNGPITAVAFSPQGYTLATLNATGAARVLSHASHPALPTPR